ncbi:MAG: 50S ribosomal protein L25 [Spirochaetales bacterium]|nr:50S ribosomal protein L25 [Spirochaetales bacterium]
MSQPVLNAAARSAGTKGDAKRLRAAGKIPAVVYNHKGESRPLSLDAKEYAKQIAGATESTLVKLQIDGKTVEAFIKDRQLDWRTSSIVHIDFYEVQKGTAMKAHVSIHLEGTPIGVRQGGILENPVHELEVECLPKDLPARIEIDVSGLEANHSVHVRDLGAKYPGLKFLSSLDQVVAVVKYLKAEAETVVETAPAAEEAPAAEKAAEPKA